MPEHRPYNLNDLANGAAVYVAINLLNRLGPGLKAFNALRSLYKGASPQDISYAYQQARTALDTGLALSDAINRGIDTFTPAVLTPLFDAGQHWIWGYVTLVDPDTEEPVDVAFNFEIPAGLSSLGIQELIDEYIDGIKHGDDPDRYGEFETSWERTYHISSYLVGASD